MNKDCQILVLQRCISVLGEKKLDLLINNAGLILDKHSVTKDGFESTFGINYLGEFII